MFVQNYAKLMHVYEVWGVSASRRAHGVQNFYDMQYIQR
jgi:hypothetical protein